MDEILGDGLEYGDEGEDLSDLEEESVPAASLEKGGRR
jgi:hypothetical protein